MPNKILTLIKQVTFCVSWKYGRSNSGAILKCELPSCVGNCDATSLWVTSRNLISVPVASHIIMHIFFSSLQMRQSHNNVNEHKIMYIFQELLHRICSPDAHSKWLWLHVFDRTFCSMPNFDYSTARPLRHIVLKVAVLKIDIKLNLNNCNTNLVQFSFYTLIYNYN